MSLTIIDVAGLKKSGKTTVVENLVQELSARGYKVGTIKKIHIPDFTIDQKGKDTYRHKQAGAEFVISLAPKEIALIKENTGKRTLEDALKLVPKDTEFLICEELNEKRTDIFYIITLKELKDFDETLRVRAVGDQILAISGVISNKVKNHIKYPVINSTNKKEIKELVDIILEKRKE